ncbi:MAG: hypothetical protein MO852_02895 [Candidatus Devosia euplotis]|nr:hypothetical protein [Candidatus Devosia euplotis]
MLVADASGTVVQRVLAPVMRWPTPSILPKILISMWIISPGRALLVTDHRRTRLQPIWRFKPSRRRIGPTLVRQTQRPGNGQAALTLTAQPSTANNRRTGDMDNGAVPSCGRPTFRSPAR